MDPDNSPVSPASPPPTPAPPPPPPLPAKIIARKFSEAQQPPHTSSGLPPGSWSIHGLSGSVAGIRRELLANDKIPARWKAALLADIEARCADGGYNFVTLHAHCFVADGKTDIHYTVACSKKHI